MGLELSSSNPVLSPRRELPSSLLITMMIQYRFIIMYSFFSYLPVQLLTDSFASLPNDSNPQSPILLSETPSRPDRARANPSSFLHPNLAEEYPIGNCCCLGWMQGMHIRAVRIRWSFWRVYRNSQRFLNRLRRWGVARIDSISGDR